MKYLETFYGRMILMSNETTLQDITKYESGIIVYPDETHILNWTQAYGIPRLDPWGYDWMGLGENLSEIVEEIVVSDVPEHILSSVEDIAKQDAAKNDSEYDGIAKCYRIPEHDDYIYVFTFYGWA